MRVDIATFIQRCPRLPSLPVTCHELSGALLDSDASIDEISNIVGKDQSLAARVLKLANSVFYGFPAQVSTLRQAVQLVGMHEIRELVLATSVIEAFEDLPEDLIDAPSFWQHSVACGVASMLLAEERNHPEPDRLFLGGLLHDIGRLALFLGAPQESRQILARCHSGGQLNSRVESEVLGFDHAALGGELLATWNLPRSLVQMVRGHHQLPKASPMLMDIFLVHYADFLVSALEFGNSGELLVSPLTVPPPLSYLKLTGDRLEQFVTELTSRCEELCPALALA